MKYRRSFFLKQTLFILLAIQTQIVVAQSRYDKGAALVAKKDYKAAAEVFREGVEAGDPACMDYLGWLYLEGHGVRQSPWIAYGFFREAADLGNSQACRNLGNMYYEARGVEHAIAQAMRWWDKAAGLGAPRAAFSLATTLYLGIETEPDKERASELWKQFAEKGHAASVVALAYVEAGEKLSEIDGQKLLAPKVKEDKQAQALLRLAELHKAGKLETYIPIEFEMQAHNFCAVATTAHILKSSGAKTSQFEIARRVQPSLWGKGSGWDKMLRVALEYGHPLELKTFPVSDEGFDEGCQLLFSELKADRPVAIDTLTEPDQRSAHTVLLTGCSKDGQDFIIRDSAQPFPGIRVIERDEFKRIWNSIGFLPTNRELKRACMILKQ